jgi:hypothetical protein
VGVGTSSKFSLDGPIENYPSFLSALNVK